ncbi:hypothetical protein QJS10_CPB20g01370 [Acorus calamus]|uniref:Uncharacterized protein n=1 Tax=Acorus calamus TaxID=4465 RepID=A0AAV9CB05_ACOCL|nr:hypothetical protein QJS10_CPB20g01370 [Acorus calamus]
MEPHKHRTKQFIVNPPTLYTSNIATPPNNAVNPTPAPRAYASDPGVDAGDGSDEGAAPMDTVGGAPDGVVEGDRVGAGVDGEGVGEGVAGAGAGEAAGGGEEMVGAGVAAGGGEAAGGGVAAGGGEEAAMGGGEEVGEEEGDWAMQVERRARVRERRRVGRVRAIFRERKREV